MDGREARTPQPRLRTRSAACAVAGWAVAAWVLAGCGGSDLIRVEPPSARPLPQVSGVPEAAQAEQLLSQLTVRPKAAGRDYQRSAFGDGWADTNGNGCRDNQDVLRAQLHDVRLKPGTHGCVVLSGILDDPYSGEQVRWQPGPESPANIDHVVALKNAWVSGAAGWSKGQRVRFANDPLELLVVSVQANEDKGELDASRWLPDNRDARCDLVERQVAVKAKYRLSVTASEHDALAKALQDCD